MLCVYIYLYLYKHILWPHSLRIVLPSGPIHHHLGDCSWVTLPGYSADLVCTDVGHCHALACTNTYSYTYNMLKVLHGVMSFLSQQDSAEAKKAFCTIAYFAIERGLSAVRTLTAKVSSEPLTKGQSSSLTPKPLCKCTSRLGDPN